MKKKFSKILGVGLTLALLCSLLLTAAPVSANVSDISVVLSDDDISAMANYTVTFKVNVDLPTAATTDTITVVFPVGTDASALTAAGDVKIRNTDGTWGTGANAQIDIPAADVTVATDKRTVTIVIDNVANDILAGAYIEIIFANTKIKNPDTASTILFLTVATSTETTAVASPTYAIALPTISVLPGVVELRNASGILMGNWTGDDGIAEAITNAGANFTINVGEGTYTQNLTIPATLTGLELVGDEGAVIKGASVTEATVGLRIDASGVKVHGFTIETSDAVASANYIYGIVVANEDVEIYDNAFVLTCAGSVDAIMVATDSLEIEEVSGLSIHDNTFTADTVSTVSSEGVYVNCNQNHLDPASTTAASLLVTIADNEFGGNIFRAITTERSKTTITGNTIASAYAPGTTAPNALRGIDVSSPTGNPNNAQDNVVITGNTVTGFLWGISLGDGAGNNVLSATSVSGNTLVDNDIGVMVRGADAAGISVNFNNITDSGATTGDYGADNSATSGTLDATFNWWGTDVAADVAAMKSGLVTVEPFLAGTAGTVFSATKVAAGATSLDAKTTVGVRVSGATGATIISAAKYIANPQEALAGAIAFYDVYVATATADVDVTIKFYVGDANSDVYIWSADTETWGEVTPAAYSAYGGYVYVTVDADMLGGTPFAVVAGAAAAIGTPVLSAPETGDDTVSLTPIFAWESVPGAEGYCFELADNVNFVTPIIQLDGELGRLFVTAYAYVGELEYSTPYYWRVKAVSGGFNPWIQWVQLAHFDVESDWATGVFITMDEPEEELPPVVIEETEPPVIIIEPIVEVVTPAATEITPAWIYLIIGVGGVLVIALLVLIVRTRRVA